MRARYRGLVSAICATAALVILTGCGSDSTDTNAPSITAGTSGAQIEIGNTINYGSSGRLPISTAPTASPSTSVARTTR